MISPPFPHTEPFHIDGTALSAAEVIGELMPFVSEDRQQRMAEVVARRTYSVVPVLEGVHDLGNVNAVLRSAEGLGYGAAHLVALEGDAAAWAGRTSPNAPTTSGIGTAQRQSQGADKWIDLHVWHDVPSAADHLRKAGYRIAATHLGADAVPIEEVDFTVPTAIVLGNEAAGVSDALLAEADLNVVLPIDGFIQSYNISVAAALALYHARVDRLRRQGFHGDLTADQQHILTAAYMLRGTKNARALLRRAAEQ